MVEVYQNDVEKKPDKMRTGINVKHRLLLKVTPLFISDDN